MFYARSDKRVFNSCVKHCTWAKKISKRKIRYSVSTFIRVIFKDEAVKLLLKLINNSGLKLYFKSDLSL